MMPIPSMSAGGGGPSGAAANNGISLPLDLAFNFDHSGWVINKNSSGSNVNATGNKDANRQSQTPQGGVLGSLVGSDSLPLLLVGVAIAFYLLNK